jgi:hypothetical protein|tara:strand:- start:154 stop:681 length:528 start_codon:yes stop_codon:yes gene_type:complete
MKFVRINNNGTMNDIDIPLKKKGLLKLLEENTTSKGTSNFKELYKWNQDGREIICYGWYDGEAGFENKHDLIPNGNSSFLDEDSSEKLLFGDLIILCYDQTKKFIDFDTLDYAQVYEILFEGFDDCDSEDDLEEEDEEPNTDDENFIVDDDHDDDSNESYEYSDEELDEDTNEYN